MVMGLQEREKWLQQVRIDAKDLLLEYYSRKFVNATDDFNEAVFRKDTESIANAFLWIPNLTTPCWKKTKSSKANRFL
jgi:hypothetical protein